MSIDGISSEGGTHAFGLSRNVFITTEEIMPILIISVLIINCLVTVFIKKYHVLYYFLYKYQI